MVFLDKVFKCFDKEVGQIPILIVPGNHDVNCLTISKAQKEFRKKLTVDIIDNMMTNSGGIDWKEVIAPLKSWHAFVNSIPNSPFQCDENILFSTGIINHSDGKKIGIAGLNSAWAYYDDDSHLWLGKRQYDLAFHKIAEAPFRIAVSHYPIERLHDDEISLRQKVESNYQVFLHGHYHDSWFNDNYGHLKCSAGACYQSSKLRNGYSWLHINLDSSEAEICLREYNDQGSSSWQPNRIVNKTDEQGRATLIFLRTKPATALSPVKSSAGSSLFASDLGGLLKTLEDTFSFRFEKESLPDLRSGLFVYWPVRLREPSPIHAAQCYAAAGLLKMNCKVALWLDDLGNKDYIEENLLSAFRKWFNKVGEDFDGKVVVRRFSEILDPAGKHMTPAWDNLQNWLAKSMYFTDQVLRIAKIWPQEKDAPVEILDEIKSRRPRRILNPSMVWTCLHVLNEEDASRPIVTLGGYDERDLWQAWRECCELGAMKVSHLYIPKLTGYRHFSWKSKEDIQTAFENAMREFYPQKWDNRNSLIPWIFNNCVLLPSYIAQKKYPITISSQAVGELSDLRDIELDDAVRKIIIEETDAWIF